MEILISSRACGKFYYHISKIINELHNNKSVEVLGLKNPNKYLLEFNKIGINVKCEPMICSEKNTLICDEFNEIIGIRYGEKKQIGWKFSLK